MHLIRVINPNISLTWVDIEEILRADLLKAEEVETPIRIGRHREEMDFILLSNTC